MPTMPRSSSGEFQAVFRPCVAVKTPPSGGPDVLAEDVGDAEVLLAVVQRHADGLDHVRHAVTLALLPRRCASQMDSGVGLRLVAHLRGAASAMLLAS